MAKKTGIGKSGNNNRPGVTESQVLSILGERRFLSADRVAAAWNKLIRERRTNHSIPPIELSGSQPIRYTEETLRKVVDDPAWCLIYDPGFSLKENRGIIGTDPGRQPSHRLDNDWWYREKEEYWTAKREEPGYQLIRMDGLFSLDNPAKDWDWQEEQIRQKGEVFQRASTRVMVNACVSFFLLNNVKCLVNYSNFGPDRDSDWCYLVTAWDQFGINLGHWLRNDWGGYWNVELRVCLARKFDI